MNKALFLALLASLTAVGCSKVAGPGPEPTTDDQKTLYAVGLALSDNLAPFNLTAAEVEFVKAGLADGTLHLTRKVDLAVYGPKIRDLIQARGKAGSETQKAAGEAFLAKAAAEKGAVRDAAGFVIQEITPGTGPSPKVTDQVKVHYKGTLTDGTVFDSSLERGQPVTFPLNGVIPCWTKALQLMKVGGKSRLVCPADLAYGDRGAPPKIMPGATLVFEVELLDIAKPK
jgi:FKBP-type peptidyl-prolyl cis-trans isomerase FkpA